MTLEAATGLLERVVLHLDTAVLIDGIGMAYLTQNLTGCGISRVGRCSRPTPASWPPRSVGKPERRTGTRSGPSRRSCRARARLSSSAARPRPSWSRPDGAVWRNEAGATGDGCRGVGGCQGGGPSRDCSRGAAPEQAAVWGAFIHGRAGERLTAAVGRVGFPARELVSELPARIGRDRGLTGAPDGPGRALARGYVIRPQCLGLGHTGPGWCRGGDLNPHAR